MEQPTGLDRPTRWTTNTYLRFHNQIHFKCYRAANRFDAYPPTLDATLLKSMSDNNERPTNPEWMRFSHCDTDRRSKRRV